MPELDGTVAIVSGGARGIGRATAERLVHAGARVLVGDVLEDEGAEVVAGLGDGAAFAALDVASADAWANAVRRATEAFGPPTALVNNAGVFMTGSLRDSTEADLRRAFEVNQLGVYLGMQAVAGPMRDAGGGAIVNVSSSAGMVGIPDAIAYSSSKWAVRGLTRAAALDLAPDGIRVTSVHPGITDTPIFAGFPREALEQMVSAQPIARLADPGEVAALICFLLSPEASFCTGAEYVVDGGYQTA